MPNGFNQLPQYRQLYETLKKGIHEGLYAPGDLLPSENELSRTYGLTRPTIRQGLGELVNEGYIRKIRGKGSVVKRRKAGIGILNIKGTTDSLPTGKLRTLVVDAPVLKPWPAALKEELSATDLTHKCVYLSRLRLIELQPIFYEETLLPNRDLPGFLTQNLNDRSLFGLLAEDYGIRVTGGAQRIRAIGAKGKIQELLQVTNGTPILRLDKSYETNRPYYHFYTSIWCRTDAYYLEGAL